MRAGAAFVLPAILAAGAILWSPPARADRIDGNWCHRDGRHMSIDGPKIITPGGTKMTGLYDRHGFQYVVPAGEAGAGAEVVMRQLNDNEIEVTTITGGAPSPWETWNRCDLSA